MIRRSVALAFAFAMAAPAFAENEALHERDDATARMRAWLSVHGQRTPEQQLRIFQAAQREAAAAPTSDAWVNIGPGDGGEVQPVPLGVDSGRIQKIVPHPTDANILYVATAGGGVWKTYSAQAAITATGGPRWFSITDSLPFSQSIGAFAIDPSSPDSLYLGLGDPFPPGVQTPGFYTSLDGGITWTPLPNLTGAAGLVTSVRDIVVDPANTGVVLVATDAGVFKSTDHTDFAYLDQFGGAADCWSIASVGFDGTSSHWLVTCGGQVFRSTDGAASFAPAVVGLTGHEGRMTLAASTLAADRVSPTTARVYLLAANSSGSDQEDVYISNTGGAQWTSLSMVPYSVCHPQFNCNTFTNATNEADLDILHDQAWYNQAIIVDSQSHDTLFIGGNFYIARSRDAGATWDLVGDWLPNSISDDAEGITNTSYLSYIHADHHAMAISPVGVGPKYFYGGTDGGLFRSSDIFTAAAAMPGNSPTIHFEDKLNRGIVSHLVYSVTTDISLASDLHHASFPVMLGGFQDNGTRKRGINNADGTGSLFNQMIGADGFGVGMGISNSSSAPLNCKGQWGSLLIGTIYGSIWRSVDCGSSFSVSMNGICQVRGVYEEFGQACDVDKDTNFYMKMASDQANTSGQVFVTVINNSTCDPSQTSCTIGTNVNTVYASTNGGALWSNSNGTITLADGVTTTTNFPGSLGFVGTNALAAGQWGVTDYNYVYTTLDGGSTWSQSAALPGGVTSMAFEDASGSIIWASTSATGHQVYRSTDRGAHWTDKSATMPADIPANTVKVNPASASTIYLGTLIGLYRSTDGGSTWARAGVGSLPLVQVTEISITLDGSTVRVSTFGRGFWEFNPSGGALSAVHGNGDFDHNQILDGFDVVLWAASFHASSATPADPDYNPIGNLTGSTNTVDSSDFATLVARLGSRP